MRLTDAQKRLLDELRETGGLYIRRYSLPGRTVMALKRKGLVRVTEPDYSSLAMDRWEVVDHTEGET